MPAHPRLAALTTAVPRHKLCRDDVIEMARLVWGAKGVELGRVMPIYDNAGIDSRYSCVPIEWYAKDHGWTERNALYVENAVTLLEQAAREVLDRAGLGVADIDAVVAVSTTGIATPSLDALLIERMGLRRDVTRLPVFGLGCAGGVLGLARAGALAQAMPGKRVLLLVVELCTLTFRLSDLSASNIVATALFGDGAAAALLSTEADGPRLTAWGEHTWPDSLAVMGWSVEDDGFGVVFSKNIPSLIVEKFRAPLDFFLEKNGLTIGQIENFLCHPGGAKVVDALEDVLEVQRGGLIDSRAVLRDYGNMSAATVMFVLDRALARGVRGRQLVSSLGPGFTVGFLTLDD